MKATTLLATIGFGLVTGYLAATALNDALAIRTEDKVLPSWQGDARRAIASPLPLRMVDLGGVGIEVDSSNWGASYSHNPSRFSRALQRDAPFVDTLGAKAMYRDFDTYAERMAALEFNAIEFGGFMHFVNFDSVGGGQAVYSATSTFRKRHEAMRSFFRPMFAKASRLGMAVYLRTDMPALSVPLEEYFAARGLTVHDREFWQVYSSALSELFAVFPEVKGVIIRVGEAGAVYNTQGSDYRSELWVRDTDAVQRMLAAFLEAAEMHDRDIIFRSWTVGVGEVGDLHTNPATYERVLGDIASPNLIVSTKVFAGDFWSHLPLNATLMSGSHRRIVELQARREFEAFNVVPNYVGGLYQGALATYTKANPNIEGVWVWTQGGGPLRRGPMMTYPFHGNWVWTDANVSAFARLALGDPGSPRDWAREWARDLGYDAADSETLAGVLLTSHRTAARGLTVPAFAEQQVRGMGLEVPPVIYSYWDIVDGSSAVSSHIYASTLADFEGALQKMEAPLEEARQLRSRLESLGSGNPWAGPMRESADYEVGLLETLLHHKRFVLSFNRWLDKGGSADGWRDAAANFDDSLQLHRANHAGNLDYPAYNFELAVRSIAQASRMGWLRILGMVLLATGLWIAFRPSLLGFWMWSSSVAAVFGALSSPLFTVLVSSGALLLIAGLHYRSAKEAAWKASVVRARILPGLLLAALISFRGPQYVWFLFWTSDAARVLFCMTIGVAVALHLQLAFQPSPHRGRRVGAGLTAMGFFLMASGATAALFGLERSLSAINEELLVLPGMLSRVLGITTHLNIPAELPAFGLVAGGLAILFGLTALARHSGSAPLPGALARPGRSTQILRTND